MIKVLHYENTPMQYTEIFFFICKKKSKFLVDNLLLKHRLWVHVRTAAPKIYVLEQKLEKYVFPVNPSFTVSKWGISGCTFHGHVFLM